jgi:hypothetical protein
MERVRQREWPARRDRHGDRYLQAALLESGDLVIEGQDLGDELPVPGTSGVTEYEFAWTIPADQIPRLVELLGGEPGDDVLDLLVGRLPDEPSRQLASLLQAHGIEARFWSRFTQE